MKRPWFTSSPHVGGPKLLHWGIVTLTLLLVVRLSLALNTRYFQDWLDADYLYPHLFACDILHQTHPLSGWTLSSSPYLFPDFLVYTLLLALQPLGGHAFTYYVALYFLSLALILGWWLKSILNRPSYDATPWLTAGLIGRPHFINPGERCLQSPGLIK